MSQYNNWYLEVKGNVTLLILSINSVSSDISSIVEMIYLSEITFSSLQFQQVNCVSIIVYFYFIKTKSTLVLWRECLVVGLCVWLSPSTRQYRVWMLLYHQPKSVVDWYMYNNLFYDCKRFFYKTCRNARILSASPTKSIPKNSIATIMSVCLSIYLLAIW